MGNRFYCTESSNLTNMWRISEDLGRFGLITVESVLNGFILSQIPVNIEILHWSLTTCTCTGMRYCTLLVNTLYVHCTAGI